MLPRISAQRQVPSLSDEFHQKRSDCKDASHWAPLWLGVYLPRLALEVFGLTDERRPAAVVTGDQQGRSLLHAVSASAMKQGVIPGMTLTSAYALCPTLAVEIRDLKKEQQALNKLAELGLAFTSWVSLDFPEALLLEVRGSLALFGSLENLTAKLRETLCTKGHRICCAAAPAPLASWLLARSGRECRILIHEQLRSVLGTLSTELLDIDRDIHDRLRKTGVSCLRDLWRLPRDGLARRYGTRLLILLDQAAGYRATPLRRFHAPPRFDAVIELPEETDRLARLVPAVEMLIARLASFLIERDASVAEFDLILVHREGAPTRLRQGARRPTRDHVHLMRLLQERLDCLRLPGPVCAVRLFSSAIMPWTPVAADLFVERSADPVEWQQLLDHLQTRLGTGALRYLSARPDHRPEYARQWTMQPQASVPVWTVLRPVWLLPAPRALSPGELSAIFPEAERIESGWWDGAAIRRDYHRAVDRRGAKLWIYRNSESPAQWYLHGLFG